MNKDEIRQKAFEILKSKCYKLIQSKFLLAQPSISAILKCIINSPDLYDFTRECLENIDCANELAKATLTKEGSFILPKSKRVTVALITYLFNQFDSNEIDLMEFVAYYYNQDTNEGFDDFCAEIVLPYITAFEELYFKNVNSEISDSNEVAVEQIQPINSEVIEMSDYLLKKILTEIQALNNISDKDRENYIAVVEGLMIAISNIDRKIIKAIFIGMKSLFAKQRKINRSVKELNKLFKSYRII